MICAFVFTFAKIRFSDDAAQISGACHSVIKVAADFITLNIAFRLTDICLRPTRAREQAK